MGWGFEARRVFMSEPGSVDVITSRKATHTSIANPAPNAARTGTGVGWTGGCGKKAVRER